MNDFTKDELQTFLEWLHHARDSARWDNYHEEPNLVSKLQSKIDNSCEHDNLENLEEQIGGALW